MIFSTSVFSQGFYWENSVRQPFKIPKLYLGGNISYGTGTLFGNTNLSNDGTRCCTFSDGTSTDFSLGLSSEYWYFEDLVLGLDFNLKFPKFNFSRNQSLPISPTDSVNLEYQLTQDQILLSFSPKIKYRLIAKLNSIFRLNTLVLLSSDLIANQIVNTTNGDNQSEFSLSNPELTDNSSFILIPEIGLSYDLILQYPMYLSPFISITYPLNYLNKENLKSFNIKFGISIYYGSNYLK